MLRTAHQRVAVRKENAVHAAVHAPRLIEIRFHILQPPHAEALFLIHIAKRALIMAAADRRLYDQTICL